MYKHKFTREQILKKIWEVLREQGHLPHPEHEVREESQLVADLGMGSLDRIEFYHLMRKELSVEDVRGDVLFTEEPIRIGSYADYLAGLLMREGRLAE